MRRVAVCAMSSSSSVLGARITPNSSSTASVTASSPAMEAVCDLAATVPSALRPTFISTTGFFAARAAARAAMKLSDSRMPST